MIFKPVYIRIILLFLLFLTTITGIADFTLNSVSYKWDVKTEEHLDELLVDAGTAYAVSRGLNAVISVIQASDINVIIGNLALGEALDPVNDIVERFSNVMLMSITSLGVQKFIYRTGVIYGVNIFLTLSALLFLTGAVFESLSFRFADRISALSGTLGTSLLVIFLLIRFIIPTAALLSMKSEKIFGTDISETIEKLDEIKAKSQIEYNAVSGEMEKADPIETEEDKSLLSKITDTMKEAGEKITGTFSTARLKENTNRVMDSLGESIEYITDLIVIFIIQTIVIPILTLFLLKASFQPLISLLLSGFKKERKPEHIYSAS